MNIPDSDIHKAAELGCNSVSYIGVRQDAKRSLLATSLMTASPSQQVCQE